MCRPPPSSLSIFISCGAQTVYFVGKNIHKLTILLPSQYLYRELRYIDWRDSFECRQALQTFSSLLFNSDDKCILNSITKFTRWNESEEEIFHFSKSFSVTQKYFSFAFNSLRPGPINLMNLLFIRLSFNWHTQPHTLPTNLCTRNKLYSSSVREKILESMGLSARQTPITV